MKIVVLCGGTSTEREVCLVTGTKVCEALRAKNHEAVLIDAFIGHEGICQMNIFENKNYSIEDELAYIKDKDINKIKKQRKDFFGPDVIEMCKQADIVFLGLHGANGEDGKVQATFDLLNIKYTGCDYIGSANAMNKTVTKQIFKAENVPMAKGFSIKKSEKLVMPEDAGIDYPCVVKTSCGGSSIGVYIVNNSHEYKDALHKAFELEEQIVVEKYIKGREFSVGVIDYKPLPIIEIIPKVGFYDYENKYKLGATNDVCPAELSDELTVKMQTAATLAAKALGLSVYCRIDVLMDLDGNCYCLEANTLPGMTPTSLLPQEAAAMGMDFPSLCDYLVEISLKKY